MLLYIENTHLDGQCIEEHEDIIESIPYKMVGFGFDVINSEEDYVIFYSEDDEYYQLIAIIRLREFIEICEEVIHLIHEDKLNPILQKEEHLIELPFPFHSYGSHWSDEIEQTLSRFLVDYDKRLTNR